MVSRACAAAQSLQIGIRAGVIVCNYELQAAFFAALGLPGTPSDTGLDLILTTKTNTIFSIPVAMPQGHPPGQMQRFEDLGAGQNQPRGPRQRRGGGGGGGGRPQDGLERDHRP